MGTRTWSRKGVLTAAGRRRAGMVGQNSTWIQKTSDGREEMVGDFADAQSAVSIAARNAINRLISNPNVYLYDETRQAIAQAQQDGVQLSMADILNQTDYPFPDADVQVIIYEMRGWNKPPAEITNWTNITGNTTQVPMMQTDTGDPVLFYRATRDSDDKSVTAEQWQQKLMYNRVHIVGDGKHGRGTYAAGASVDGTLNGQGLTNPQRTAEHVTDYGNSVTVFGLKQGSHVYTPPFSNNQYSISQIDDNLYNRARQIAKCRIPTTSIAVAILGYDAYQATPSGYEDNNPPYFVILNRNAMVISKTQGQTKPTATNRPTVNWQTGKS